MPSDAGRRCRARRFAGQARASLLWGIALFAVAHVALLIGTQGQRAELRDPEFGCKLSRLRQHWAIEPDRPVLVVLGSSRTGQGFRPGVLPAFKTADGQTPFVFNFSQVGSGPLAELLCLRRLLDAGVRPDWLAIEILPPMLGRTVDACGNTDVGVSRLSGSDLRLLRRYVSDPGTLARRWVEAQLAPWHAHRFSLMNHYAGDFLPWRLRMDQWKALDAWGWSDLGVDTEHPVKDPRALEVARETYQDELKNFHVTPMQDRALRDLIALCRQEAIPTVLYLMPEGSIFRSWYVPATRAAIEDYLTRLSRECDVPILDARLWMPDDLFADSHHLDRRGATRFTRRFGEEVIPSLVQGKLDAIRPVLVPLHGTYPESQSEQTPRLEAQVRPASPSLPPLSINGGTPPARSPGKSGESRSIP
jgi:hypothetical protein